MVDELRDAIRAAVERWNEASPAGDLVLTADDRDDLSQRVEKAVGPMLDRALDEVARLKHQPIGEHPLPWRLGTKLDDTALGEVTLYDGTLEGDGGRPGRFIGVLFRREIGERVVAAVNGLAELEAEVRRLSDEAPADRLSQETISRAVERLPRMAALLREGLGTV